MFAIKCALHFTGTVSINDFNYSHLLVWVLSGGNGEKSFHCTFHHSNQKSFIKLKTIRAILNPVRSFVSVWNSLEFWFINKCPKQFKPDLSEPKSKKKRNCFCFSFGFRSLLSTIWMMNLLSIYYYYRR